METFKVNFDLRGGLTMEEWIEQCLSPEKKSPKRRHADIAVGTCVKVGVLWG